MPEDRNLKMGEPVGGEEQDELEKLEEALNTPMTKEEAEKELAELDVHKLQMQVVRQKWLSQIKQLELQIASLDVELYSLEMNRGVVFRRTLNAPKEA